MSVKEEERYQYLGDTAISEIPVSRRYQKKSALPGRLRRAYLPQDLNPHATKGGGEGGGVIRGGWVFERLESTQTKIPAPPRWLAQPFRPLLPLLQPPLSSRGPSD